MAPPAYGSYAVDNMQDVGGMGFQKGMDKHALTADTVDAPLSEAIEKSGKPVKYWEYQVHALSSLLVGGGKVRPGEMRRAIEFLPVTAFSTKTYYEKWAAAIATTMIERGTITQPELDAALGKPTEEPPVMFKAGDYVKVKPENAAVRYRKPHLRIPGYLFGVVGFIPKDTIGYLEEPDIDAFHYVDGPQQPVYRVVFWQKDLWEGYHGTDNDNLEIEIWQSWLEPASKEDLEKQQANRIKPPVGFDSHNSGHNGHDHGHKHEEREEVEKKAIKDEGDDTEKSRFIEALIKILTGKGIVSAADITGHIEELESYGSRGLGPRVVARAWSDPEFKKRLLEDGVAGVTELGVEAEGWKPYGGVTEPNGQLSGIILKVVENTPKVHHLLVCTLCSCYPISVLGMAPSWYKARSYRARSVRDPRAVLKEFGTEIPEDVTIQVLDSNADSRFLSIPLRPEGTEGWTDDQLQALVTRDSIVGVSLPKTPAQLKKEGGTFFPKTKGYKGRFIYQ